MRLSTMKFFMGLIIAGVFISSVWTGGAAAESKPIVLKTVTFLPEGHGSAWGWWFYKDMLNKAAKGRLIIEFSGGPETIKGFEQPGALMTGAIDVNYNVGAYYKTIIPEANCMVLSKLTPWEERKSGFHDFMVKLFRKKGIFYLGRQLINSPFILATSKLKIQRPQDLKGLRFRTAALYDALFKKLGVIGITIPIGDQYSALERSLVDGTATTPSSALKYSFHEVCKYVIGPTFYGAQNGVMLINLNVWNRIPQDLKDLMIETQMKAERLIWEHYENTTDDQLKKLKSNGMEFVEWSEADSKLFLDIAYDAAWEEIAKKTNPQTASRLKKLITP